jgi:AcrR family transcriptional regulator
MLQQARIEGERARPGGRSARVVRAVLDAALELFAERGYAGLSFDEVAARAEVNKTTVYRRWPTKADLVRAALLQLRDDEPPVPDLGAVREDLFVLLQSRVARLRTPRGHNLARAVLLGSHDGDLANVLRDLRRERPIIPQVVIDRAVERAELPRGVDGAFLAEALLGVVHGRLLWRAEVVTDADLRRIVDLIVAGAAAGAAPRKPAHRKHARARR